MPGINKEERPVRRLSSNPARKELSSIPARRGSSSIPARRGFQLNNVPLMDTNKLSASSDRDGLSSVDAETLLLQEKAQHLLELRFVEFSLMYLTQGKSSLHVKY